VRRGIGVGIVVIGMAAPALAAPGAGSVGGFSAQEVVGGLAFPAAFTFAPDGRIFYGERFSGEIRIYDPDTESDTLFFTVEDLETSGERGLLGIALHPNYPAVPRVYAYATRNVGTIRNQILRLRDSGGTGCCQRVIFSSDTVSGSYHDGGRILFGPDDRLYAIVGEAHDPSNAQDLSNNAGKILRMTPNGGVPSGNPFPGSLIWAYGIRNSFGFTFDPVSGLLWEDENGPTCNDEVNPIRPGRNYGWGPNQTCSVPPQPPLNTNQDGPNPQLPEVWFTPTTAPTGNVFCDGCGLGGSEGNLFWGEWNTGDIRRAILTLDRKEIASQSVVYMGSSGILSMERGIDGAIYFSDPDQIFKLVN
jgi:aldose sugar dehydrogenase